MNVLFVCSGNTCRSPMAKLLLSSIAEKNDMDIKVDSAGLFAYEGEPASNGSISVMQQDFGLDLSDHSAKTLDESLAEWADRIVCMTAAHKELVKVEFPQANTCTLGEWAKRDLDIRDPHGGKLEDYRECAKLLKELLDDIVGVLWREYGNADPTTPF